MAIHFLIMDMDDTFKTLEFGRFLGEKRNRLADGSFSTTHRYMLFSSKQVADEVIVELPEKAGRKGFPFRSKIQLVNPKVRPVGQVTGDNAHRSFELTAENMTRAEGGQV